MTAKIKLNSASGGGSISIQAPSSSSNNRVISLPDIADGTLVTSQSTLDATKLSGALPAISGANLTGLTYGLNFAQWRVNTVFSGGADPIVNWTQTTDKNVTLTESSGIFSFPSTGYWEIFVQLYGYYNADSDNAELHIMQTHNNSSYSTKSQSYTSLNNDDGGNLYTHVNASYVFKCADTANSKIKFKTANTSINWAADSTRNDSYAIFTKLGDI